MPPKSSIKNNYVGTMYEIAATLILYVMASVMLGVAGAWVYLLKSMTATFRRVPRLGDNAADDNAERRNCARNYNAQDMNHAQDGSIKNISHANGGQKPMVSVILPARNETDYIRKCLDSLASQDYENYEVIAIDDSSDDDTFEIISQCARKYPGVIVPVSARPKPEGWMGKNWACMEGYQKAKGDLLLFTDADTRHDKNVITLAVKYFDENNLDALTVMPKMLAPDFWIKTSLPMISVFLHTRFSALNVNDPKSRTGYFFGSFFILKRDTYESVGTHKSVRGEMIEDGALGRKTKEAGHNMRMVRGEHLIDAVWARDLNTLWHALRRLIIPLRAQNGLAVTSCIVIAIAFLLFMPFLSLGIAAALTVAATTTTAAAAVVPPPPDDTKKADLLFPALIMFFASTVASGLVWAGSILESKTGLHIGSAYGLFAPLGGLVVSAGFLAGLLSSNPSLVWRGRTYAASDISDKQFAAV